MTKSPIPIHLINTYRALIPSPRWSKETKEPVYFDKSRPVPSRRMSTDERTREILSRNQTSASQVSFSQGSVEPVSSDDPWMQMRSSIMEGVAESQQNPSVYSSVASAAAMEAAAVAIRGKQTVNSSLDTSDSFELDDTDLQVDPSSPICRVFSPNPNFRPRSAPRL